MQRFLRNPETVIWSSSFQFSLLGQNGRAWARLPAPLGLPEDKHWRTQPRAARCSFTNASISCRVRVFTICPGVSPALRATVTP